MIHTCLNCTTLKQNKEIWSTKILDITYQTEHMQQAVAGSQLLLLESLDITH